MTFKVKENKFKVICQKCGKTGEISFLDKPEVTGFILCFGEKEDSDKVLEFEYYLCIPCYARSEIEKDNGVIDINSLRSKQADN